jgi:putative protease
MNIVARIKNLSEINHLINIGVDVFLVDTMLSVRKINPHIYENLLEICKFNKPVYLSVNKMIHEDDLETLDEIFFDAKKYGINGIVIGDLTGMVVAKKYNLLDKIIYQPGTMNTNSFDSDYFFEKGIKGITISKEITLEEIEKIFKNKKTELSIIGHGYLDMFYSRRKLLTNYFKFKALERENIIDNYSFRLKEEVRENSNYPILEEKFGTHIFRDYALESYDELEILQKGIDDFFVERIFLEDEEYYEAIIAYKNKDNVKSFLEKHHTHYNKGFYYTYTEKLKGDSND